MDKKQIIELMMSRIHTVESRLTYSVDTKCDCYSYGYDKGIIDELNFFINLIESLS